VQRYILSRIVQSLVTLLGVSVIIFSLARMSGNPLDVLLPAEASAADHERMAQLWGLDRPLYEQYWVFISNAVRGDFGVSLKYRGQSAMGLVFQRLPATLQLAAFAVVISAVMSLALGVMSAAQKDRPLDTFGKTIALLGQSMPTFWLGIVLIWIFAVKLAWLPTSGQGGFANIVLPGLTLGWFSVAAFMRLTRSSMLDVLDSEYIKLARAKGLPEWKVLWKHALKNAAIAPLTFFGLIVGFLITGSVTVETVFAWPGIGLLAIEAVNARDYQVIQAVTLVGAVVYIVIGLVVDVLYGYVDPRVRYS
jgi:peptide/nickel transport system permease protein